MKFVKPILTILGSLLVMMPFCLFAGSIMFPIVGGALYPPLNNISYPVFERNGDRVVFGSTNFSYKPGQQGTIQEHFLLKPNGERKNINLRIIVVSALIYSIILWLISVITTIIVVIKNHIPLVPSEGSENIIQASLVLSIYINGGISLAIMAAGFLYGLIWIVQALINAW